MKLWRMLLVFLPLVLLGGGPARAAGEPDPEALKAAKELSAIVTTDMLKQMSAQVLSLTWPGIEKNLKAKQTLTTAQIDSLRQDLDRIQVDYFSELMEDAIPLYARHFTAAELREMLAFYKTPVGKKAIRELPQVMTEMMAIITPKMTTMQNEIMQAFGKVLRKRGLSI
jgi:hypothetical protein